MSLYTTPECQLSLIINKYNRIINHCWKLQDSNYYNDNKCFRWDASIVKANASDCRLSRRATHYCVVEDLKLLHTSLCMCDDETCIQDVLVILKRALQNQWKIFPRY